MWIHHVFLSPLQMFKKKRIDFIELILQVDVSVGERDDFQDGVKVD